jgi:hypothetical protein
MRDKVASLGQFTELIRTIRHDWTLPDHKELWFRGEKRDYGDTRLRPALYRPPKDRSLRATKELLEIEDDLFEKFQHSSGQLSDTGFVDDFDAYMLMQHHGGPTRLLDWSDGSLMALHFALRDKPGDAGDSIVYVLEPYRLMDKLDALPETTMAEEQWEKYAESDEDADDDVSSLYIPTGARDSELELPRVPLLLNFPHLTRRVAAQRSQFIVFGSQPTWLADEAERKDSAIRTIIIDGSKARMIRSELRECGVTESVIFPDLDGLGRELRQFWEERQ